MPLYLVVMAYLQRKGFKENPGSPTDTALTEPQWRALLDAVEDSKETFNKHWRRDRAAIYLGYMFALRIGECCILERDHFSDLAKNDTVKLPTQGKGTSDVPMIEEATIAYVLDYLENHMRPDQRWLFEGKTGYHICQSYLSRIFNTYASATGLGPEYSWQSLRHGRGYRLWAMCRDLPLVARGLRCSVSAAQRYADLDAEAEKEYRKTLNRVAYNPLKHRKVGR